MNPNFNFNCFRFEQSIKKRKEKQEKKYKVKVTRQGEFILQIKEKKIERRGRRSTKLKKNNKGTKTR